MASLNSWEPHITLGDGIILYEEQLSPFDRSIEKAVSSYKPFMLSLSDFGFLDNWNGGSNHKATPYVIYINVVLTETLAQLVNAIATATESNEKWYCMPRPYLPHVTLAFRDLTKKGYEIGKNYLEGQKVLTTAEIDHVALVEKLPHSNVERTRIWLK